MREFLGALIPSFMGAGMPEGLSSRDLRERVITAGVETGAVATRGSRAFRGQGVASAVKWLQRWYQQRSAAPKPRGGSVSPLEEFAGRDFGSDRPTAGPDLW